MNTDYDVLIVGGGLVGASLACALADTPLRIGLIEATAFNPTTQTGYDDRVIALSYGTQRIFESIGLWDDFAKYSTPITDIHISDRGHFGATRLSATTENVPALGQVIPAHALNDIFQQHLTAQANLSLHCPARISSLTQQTEHVDVMLDDGTQYTTRCVVAADGAQSAVRQQLGLGADIYDYKQTAIITTIRTERPPNNQAFERFTGSGPLALLPMQDNRCSVVWTVNAGDEQALLAMSDADFLAALQTRFGYRLGHFLSATPRSHFPLRGSMTDQPVQHRVVLIGNAAHTLHPVAGQGFNLGVRDVAALAEVLVNGYHSTVQDCGDARTLSAYKQWRETDQHQVLQATSGLITLFSNDNPLLGHLRGAGLAAVNAIPPLKSWLAQHSMGRGQKQPKLGRRLPL